MVAKYLQLPEEERKKAEEEAQKRFQSMASEFVGEPAPDFSFETVSGQKGRLSDFRGKYVLLDFWSTWCAPCVHEIPNLIHIHEKYGDRGLVMISVSNDAKVKKWTGAQLSEYANEKGMKWMQILDDLDGSIFNLYRINFVPNLFLIDPQGKVIERQKLRGEELKKTLAQYLGE